MSTKLGARVARLNGTSRSVSKTRSVNKTTASTPKARSLSGKAKGCGCRRK